MSKDNPQKEGLTRREVLLAGAAGATISGLAKSGIDAGASGARASSNSEDIVQGTFALGFPWQTFDPFLFCVHHHDAYPIGNEQMGPAASLEGRNMGSDFEGKDGWRMYHGATVPGFPQHPHRGFETVTVVRSGLIDHSDSLGATARYGAGDTQWLTAGAGIVHAEMFPLVNRERPNPAELFQIWLNLPRSEKFAQPHFAMFWRDAIPTHSAKDENGRATSVHVVAGQIADARPPAPPPHSWAARPDSEVAIWSIKMEPNARFTLPPASAGTNRTLYFFQGKSMRVGTRSFDTHAGIRVRADVAAELTNGDSDGELLVLQGRPIGEPVVQYGPFVMNSEAEIHQAFADYRRTGFGGWPWPSDDPVHSRESGRFATHADGSTEHGSG